jgi:endoglucanase
MYFLRRQRLYSIVLLFFIFLSVSAQVPFNRGVNLTGWFQADSPGQIQFSRFTRQDIINIKSLGCDVIRLPVNLHSMTSGSPSYNLDPIYVSFLDSVITWCEKEEIYLIIDNHSFDPNVNTSSDIGTILNKVWSQTAAHLKDRSGYIMYEILNEPHGITTQQWGTIQGNVINTIRQLDSKHTIIVGGSGYNSYTELANLPVYTYDNLLYTFHFYDPFMFTHQGASWTSPSMVSLSGVPFPYDAATMPACPAALRGTWVENSLAAYPSEGTADHVRQLIDIAINFRDNRNVNIFCGEFGVYIPNSDSSDRAYWYEIVRQYLEQNNIPWTIWDYKGSFGLFNKGSNELFNHDLNLQVVQALNLSAPPQTPSVIRPDSAGFMIYSDYTGENIVTTSSGKTDFYCNDTPDNGHYCLHWHYISQYDHIEFDFIPDKDLTKLQHSGYAIDFMIRGNVPGINFDIRFIDTKTTDADDHPWRIGRTITGNDAAWDRKWHHVHIPLTSFEEKGAWDNGLWFNPEGKFNWAAADRFEISMEEESSGGVHLWFDNIHITNRDTAVVREPGALVTEQIPDNPGLNLLVRPNPVRYSAELSYSLPEECVVTMSVYNITGSKVATLIHRTESPGDHALSWNGCGDSGNRLPQGLYLCLIEAGGKHCSGKIILD